MLTVPAIEIQAANKIQVQNMPRRKNRKDKDFRILKQAGILTRKHTFRQ